MENEVYDNKKYSVINAYGDRKDGRFLIGQDDYDYSANNKYYQAKMDYDRDIQYEYYNSYDNTPYITDGNDYFNEKYDYVNNEYAYLDTKKHERFYNRNQYENDLYKRNNKGSSYDNGKNQKDYKNKHDSDIELRQLSVSIGDELDLGRAITNDYWEEQRNEYDLRDYTYLDGSKAIRNEVAVSGDNVKFEDMFIINSQYFEEDENEKLISLKDILNLLICVVLSVLAAVMIVEYAVKTTDVNGESMSYTLMDKDTLLVDQLTYKISNPERFDIVIFPVDGKNGREQYVKRVVGLPGESIRIVSKSSNKEDERNKIFINGKELKGDKYALAEYIESGTEKEITLADDEYFVLGDNRNKSTDSRDSRVGPIKRNLIIGKVIFRVYPTKYFGIINHSVNDEVRDNKFDNARREELDVSRDDIKEK